MAMQFNGVTYYKLSDRLYGDDKVKNCSLTASEIDWNFNFLRGMDIADAFFDKDDAKIYLVRFNDDTIAIDGLKEYLDERYDQLEADIELEQTAYVPETGVLTLVINGVEKELTGFTIPSDFTVKTGEGLKGNGTEESPLRLDLFAKTGFYAPADRLIDLTNGENLPSDEEELSACKKYLTKENVPAEGLEYTYPAVMKIAEMLEKEGKGWRIANLDDWNGVLDFIECDPDEEYPPHTTLVEGSENGRLAGNRTKADIEGWSGGFCDAYGMSILPTDTGTNGSLETTFWTTDKHADGGVHAKKFHADRGTVQHRIENTDANNLHCIRLVNDNVNLECTQVICGVPYKTVRMQSKDGDDRLWTTTNAYFSEFLATGEARVPSVTSEAPTRYFLNEWNPYEQAWAKHEVEDDYMLVLKEYEGDEDVEVMVKDGKLVRRTDQMYDSNVKPVVDELNQAIADLSGDLKDHVEFTNDALSAVTTAIEGVSADMETKFERVNSTIDGISEAVAELREDVDDLSEEVSNKDSAVNTRIDNLSADTNARLNTVASSVSNLFDELDGRITSEVTVLGQRIDSNADSFNSQIESERNERVNADNALAQSINDAKSEVSGNLALAIGGLRAEIDSTNDRIDDLGTTVEAVQATLGSITEDVSGDSGLSNKIAGLINSVDNIEEQLQTVSNRLDNGDDANIQQGTRISELENRMQQAEADIATRATSLELHESITDVNNRITTEILNLKANELCDLQNQITELSGSTEANRSNIEELSGATNTLQSQLAELDDKKVDKVEGKGLSTNDFTNADVEKLGGIEDGAQENVIETVKVNGRPLPVEDKAVDITIPDCVLTETYERDSEQVNGRLTDLENRATETEQNLHALDDTYSAITHDLSDSITTGLDALNDTYSAITHDLSDRIDTLEELLGNNGEHTLSGKTVEVHVREIESAITEMTERLSAIKGVLEPVKGAPTVKLESSLDESYPDGKSVNPVYTITVTPHTLKYVNGYEIPVETVINYTLRDGDRVIGSGSQTISSTSAITVDTGVYDIDASTPIRPNVTVTYNLATAIDPVSGNEVTLPSGSTFAEMHETTGFYPVYYKSMLTSQAEYELVLEGTQDVGGLVEVRELHPRHIPVDTNTNTMFILLPQASLDGPLKKIVDEESGFDLLDEFVRKSTSIDGVPYYLYGCRSENTYDDVDPKHYLIVY